MPAPLGGYGNSPELGFDYALLPVDRLPARVMVERSVGRVSDGALARYAEAPG